MTDNLLKMLRLIPGLLCSIFLPIMLLSAAQKLPIMLNIMPITTAIMPQFIYNFIIFNNYISTVRLQSVYSLIFTCCDTLNTLISDLLLCTILCSWENLCLILYLRSYGLRFTTILQKDIIKTILKSCLAIMLALCLMFSEMYYAQ